MGVSDSMKYGVIIDKERCKGCEVCIASCPFSVIAMSEEVNSKGYRFAIKVNDECTGCKACIASCPYDARFVHPEGYIDKCTFCIHRVKEGKNPACVAVCPTHAMIFGDLDDRKSEISKALASRKLKTLIPEAGTSPRVYYLL